MLIKKFKKIRNLYSNIIILITLNIYNSQVTQPKEVMNEWQKRPQILISRYIRKQLAKQGRLKPLSSSGSIKSPRRFKLVQQESEAHE